MVNHSASGQRTSSSPQSHGSCDRPTALVQLEDLQHPIPIGLFPYLPCSEHRGQGVILVHLPEIVNELLEARAMPFNLAPGEAVNAGHIDVIMLRNLLAFPSISLNRNWEGWKDSLLQCSFHPKTKS